MMPARPIVLALDQAESSGWCIHDAHRPFVWGLARSAFDRASTVLRAKNVAQTGGCRLLVFYEDHSAIPASVKRNTATILGMGDARGRWLEQLELAGHPRAWIVGVTPDEWRGPTIGTHGGTDAIKRRAVQFASALVGQTVVDHNTAEAICIARWAAFDGVSNFLGKRDVKRAVERAKKARAG